MLHGPERVIISIDGVNETNSTSRSLQVVSMQFSQCQEVYPCLIARPEPFEKKNMKDSMDVYLQSLLEEFDSSNLQIEKVVMDAPERAAWRKQKQHGGYYSCDFCVANPENIQIPGKRGSKCHLIWNLIHSGCHQPYPMTTLLNLL